MKLLGKGFARKKLPSKGVDTRAYKEIDGRQLRLHVFYPAEYSATATKAYPVAASVHGGGWTTGPIEWGDSDAQFMASLGFVGIAVEYRLADKKRALVLDCVKDVASAIRWIRLNAKELNLDPTRVLAIGHSAGGHLCLSAAMFPGIMEGGEDGEISSIPNAVVALAPVTDLLGSSYFQGTESERAQASTYSPIEHARKLDMPLLIIHGSADESVPLAGSLEFTQAMKALGNNIELKVIPRGAHNLFYDDPEGIVLWKNWAREFARGFLSEKRA